MARSSLATRVVGLVALALCVLAVASAPVEAKAKRTTLPGLRTLQPGAAPVASAEASEIPAATPAALAAFNPAAEQSQPRLASGVWLHNGPADRVLISTTATLGQDDHRHGLATKAAPTAHYATLALDNTYAKSQAYCASVGGSLCPLSKICPKGAGHNPVGHRELPYNRRSWAPVSDAVNMWANLAPGPYPGKPCITDVNVSWGATPKTLAEINIAYENHSKSLVPCCNHDGIMKSFLRPGAKYPGVTPEDEAEGAIRSLPRYRIPVSVLGGSGVGPWGNVNKPLRNAASWVWNLQSAASNAPAPKKPLRFQKRIKSPKARAVKLYYVIDDIGEVFLNGNKVGGGGGGWGINGKPSELVLHLRRGLNVLELHCRNGGGPAGFIAAGFSMKTNQKLFSTDKSWTVDRLGP